MPYKVGDKFSFWFFGAPKPAEIVEEKDGLFFCKWVNANGGSWHPPYRIDEEIENCQRRRNQFYQNGGNNGTTGHGPDISMSDADPGL